MSTELPPLWALDMAARAAGKSAGWAFFEVAASEFPDKVKTALRVSIIAHARTLAKYEPEPVDPAELKRRQDAREAAVTYYSEVGCGGEDSADQTRRGDDDGLGPVTCAYIALCHRDGTTPVPVEEWGK